MRGNVKAATLDGSLKFTHSFCLRERSLTVIEAAVVQGADDPAPPHSRALVLGEG